MLWTRHRKPPGVRLGIAYIVSGKCRPDLFCSRQQFCNVQLVVENCTRQALVNPAAPASLVQRKQPSTSIYARNDHLRCPRSCDSSWLADQTAHIAQALVHQNQISARNVLVSEHPVKHPARSTLRSLRWLCSLASSAQNLVLYCMVEFAFDA